MRQIVVRRVHAVVEVPVKEESLDRDMDIDAIPSSAATNIASTSTLASKSAAASQASEVPMSTELTNATPRAKRKASAKRSYVEIDDDESERDSTSKQSDTEEYQPVSDGDDELLMGTEVGKTPKCGMPSGADSALTQTNRKEAYAMKRVPKPASLQKATRPPTVAKKRKAPAVTITKKNRPLKT